MLCDPNKGKILFYNLNFHFQYFWIFSHQEELEKFLSLTRMLYWPQVHWLKIMSVMVGSINQVSLFNSAINFNSLMPFSFRILMKQSWCCSSFWQKSLKVVQVQFQYGSFANVLNISRSLIAAASKHFLMDEKFCKLFWISFVWIFLSSIFRSGNVLEDETNMPSIPRKLSSTSFRNAVIDYWKYRIENDEKVKDWFIGISNVNL